MTPRTEEQFNEIRKERRSEILNVALELFAHDGYHATSISTIARKAGISKGLLYNYFKSKEELLKEIIISTTEMVHVELDPNHDGKVTPKEFMRFIKITMKNIRDNVIHWKLYASVSLQKDVLDLLMGEMQDLGQSSVTMLMEFFSIYFGEKAEEEILHFSALTKGVMLQFLALNDNEWLDKNERMLLNYYREKLNIQDDIDI